MWLSLITFDATMPCAIGSILLLRQVARLVHYVRQTPWAGHGVCLVPHWLHEVRTPLVHEHPMLKTTSTTSDANENKLIRTWWNILYNKNGIYVCMSWLSGYHGYADYLQIDGSTLYFAQG